MVERNCEECGAPFQTFPSRIKRGGGRYCSRTCSWAVSLKNGRGRYERTAEHKATMRAATADVKPTEAALAAAAAVNTKRLRGPENPKWNGGVSYVNYGSGFGSKSLRAFIVARDKVCQDCGVWDERPRQMQMHHIDEDRDNHDPSNLVLLCVKCHNKRHKKH
jgi:hypothetical protein